MSRLLLSAMDKRLNLSKLVQAVILKASSNTTVQYSPLTLCSSCFLENTNENTKSSNQRTSISKLKKPLVPPKITLIAPNNALSVSTLEEARKLAKRRELHLVQVEEFDPKTQRPVYKLLKVAELIDEDLKDNKDTHNDKNKNKSEKMLTVGSRISDHDLTSRLKNVSKWLSKRHEVRVLIQGSPNEIASCEKIAKTIEDSVKQPDVIGKIVNKHKKGSMIKFNILPVGNVDTPVATVAESSA